MNPEPGRDQIDPPLSQMKFGYISDLLWSCPATTFCP